MPRSNLNRPVAWFTAGAASALIAGAAFAGLSVGADPDPRESTFVPITPCRLFDTRPAPNTIGPRSSPLGAADTHSQAVHGTNGDCDIPSTATAVALNVTAINPTARSFLTLFPSDVDLPLAANLNVVADAPPTPNKVDVKLSTDGRISVYNEAGTVNVAADVAGYYTNTGIADLQAQIDALAAPKEHTVAYGATELMVVGQTRERQVTNNCTRPDISTPAFVPLALPVGATIVEVRVDVLDNFGEEIEIALVEEVPRPSDFGPIGVDREDVLRAEVGTTEFGRFTHTLTPTTPPVVEEGTAFAIEFYPIDDSHGFCNAMVTFDVP